MMSKSIKCTQLAIVYLVFTLNVWAKEPTACLTMQDSMHHAKKVDSDKDGVNNFDDNCISIKNPEQKDRDDDGVGDVCDTCPDLVAKGYMNGCPVDPSIDPDNPNRPSPRFSMRVKKHKGAYFSIAYPEGFEVKAPYSKDEAYFVSKGKNVEYFVYAPLWGGEPEQYLKMQNNEKRINEKTTRGKNTNPNRDRDRDVQTTKWVSFGAKDDSYTRSYVHIKRTSSNEDLKMTDIDLVFGFKYKNDTAYNIYVNAYRLFKKSLEQFAD